MFMIEDDFHAEPVITDLASFDQAMELLRDWSAVPWGQPPHLAPCAGGEDCHRDYVIVEFDVSETPWKELRRVPALEVSQYGVRWLTDN